MIMRSVKLGAILLSIVAVAAPAATAAGGELSTRVTMLVGFPRAGEAGPTATVVPGMVIPVRSMPAARAVELAKEGKALKSVASVAGTLERTLGLGHVEVGYGETRRLAVGTPADFAGPTAGSTTRATVTLLGFNEEVATYRVALRQAGAVLADTRVAALRGERAVVGGVDGEAAPYFFLVLEPASEIARFDDLEGDVTPPRILVKEMPGYPEPARSQGTQGAVVLQAVIDESGEVTDLVVIQGQPDGLSEAAVEAVRRWRFEPARLGGKPIAVYYNLTVNFRLADKEAAPAEG